MKINLGCGISKQAGYLNIDIDLKCNPDKVANMINLDFIEDESVEVVETYHTVEHLWPDEVPKFFQEMKRIIKRGGKLIIECPDLQKCMDLMNSGATLIGLRGVYGASPEDKIEIVRIRSNIHSIHKSGFTKAIFKKYLVENGFKIIRFYDSSKYHGFPQRDTGVEAVKR